MVCSSLKRSDVMLLIVQLHFPRWSSNNPLIGPMITVTQRFAPLLGQIQFIQYVMHDVVCSSKTRMPLFAEGWILEKITKSLKKQMISNYSKHASSKDLPA